MIRSRNTEETNLDKNKKQVVDGIFIEDTSGIKHPEFRTYQEEAAYIIKLLKAQGTDIYDSNRYGGMYLKQKSKESVPDIFKNEETINNVEESIDLDFESFFSK